MAVFSAPSAAAQSQVVFQEDFENGFGAWTTQVTPAHESVQWHIAQPGECGVAITHMAAIGSGCSYGGAVPQSESLVTPPFVVPSKDGLTLSLDAFWDMDADGSNENILSVTLFNPASHFVVQTYTFQPEDKGVFSKVNLYLDVPEAWVGDPIQLQLGAQANTTGNAGKGLYIDNIRVLSNAATDLGLTEPHGPDPALIRWVGPLQPELPNWFVAYDLPPVMPALLVVGPSLQPALANQVLVNPGLAFTLAFLTGPADPFGYVAMSFPVATPPLPPGFTIYLQLLTLDAAGDLSASNTLQIVSS